MTDVKYMLNDKGEPVPELDLLTWAKAMETETSKLWRVVGQDKDEEHRVSTVFLYLDHSFGKGPPILWETMVFDAKGQSIDSDRCAGGREQAEAMHAAMLAKYNVLTKLPG